MSVRRLMLAWAVLAGATLLPATAQGQTTDPCSGTSSNPIACENSKPGTPPSTWDIGGNGDLSIQGFATSMSVNKGSSISFKIKSDTANYTIDVYRMGYYAGNGARLIASNIPKATSAVQNQPACLPPTDTGLIDCGNWAVSATWTVPSTAVSGVYIAHLTRNDTGGSSHITFVVRDDGSTSDMVVQTSDATWQAYNAYGGNSLYRCSVGCPPGNPQGYKGAFEVSYNRPFAIAGQPSWFRSAEYPMIRFLEANGYDVSYISQIDTQARGGLIKNHRLFMSSGHDEYWSGTQRANVESARDAGVNLAFFSGNEVFWKTRYRPSADGTGTPDRTLVSYKDTHFNAPTDPVAWTGTWRDRRYSDRTDAYEPENSLTGQSFIVNAGTSTITVPAVYKNLRMWRNTAVTGLSTGQSLALAPGTLGYEWDEDPDNGYRPAGQFRLSSTTVSGVEIFADYGSRVKQGTATHNLTLHKRPSGALVFGAGTVQWAWGLDSLNPRGNAPDRNMQQATVNLFADMSARPATLQSGLVAASRTTDTTPPTATITSPTGGSVNDGSLVTVTGTAIDTGGVVAGVEISTDNGATWHPATGTGTWSYSWVAHGAPATTLKVRATDDSGNTQLPGAGVDVAVNCPCSLFGPSVTPETVDSGDSNAVEVGMKFRSDSPGKISGIRFYKASTNTGTHTGSLWSADGQRLATATFTGESGSGWQTVTFSSPVAIQADTTYVASYFAPNGRYSVTNGYFYPRPAPPPHGLAITDSGPLHALHNSSTVSNGVYRYGTSGGFPNLTYDAANYWVDVLFSPTTTSPPGTVTGVSAAESGPTSAKVTWTAPTTGGDPTSYEVVPYIGSTAQTPQKVTGSPLPTTTTVTGLTTGTTYTFRVRAVNASGPGPLSAASNPVTPQSAVAPSAPGNVIARPATQSARVSWDVPQSDGGEPITGYTVTPYIGATAQTPVAVPATETARTITGLTNGTAYTFRVTATNAVGESPPSTPSDAVTPRATIFDFATPATVDSNDPNGVELGVKFQAGADGSITGIRFHKAPANTGTHTGSLWTASGTRLAQATFSNESASGWQTATFATPVPITAGTTYIASYYAPGGRYSVTSGGLSGSTGVTNGSLKALGNSISPNGVYAYGAASTFPSRSYNASNYFVDVNFAPASAPASGTAPGTVTGVTATAGKASANVSWNAPSSGGAPTSYEVIPYIGSTAQTSVTVTGSPPATSHTITGLTPGTAYTFRVRAVNAAGQGPLSEPSNAVTPTGSEPPGAPTNLTAQGDTKSAVLTWSEPADDGGSPITGYRVTPYIGATPQAQVDVDPGTRARITGLSNGTSYTFTIAAKNANGTGPESSASSAVIPRDSIFDLAVPATADSGDKGAVELGVKFRAEKNGTVHGVRFYKSDANTGTHTGNLWTTGGTRLATATFKNESSSGWQTVHFAEPVPVTANTVYVASYHAPNGRYSYTGGGLSSGIDNAPLHALANSTSSNGVYTYGTTSVFPTKTYNAANYWVDVLYTSGGS